MRTTSNFPVFAVDNLMAWRDDATGLQTEDLHEVTIVTQLPDGDGATNAWAPLGAGANYVEVDEATEDGDTSYVSIDNAVTANGDDLYTYPDFGIPAGATVHAACVSPYSKALDATARNIAGITDDGSNQEVIDATALIQDEYRRTKHITELAPDGTVWTPADFDGTGTAIEFGVENS
jgi:hypothetical protein